MSVCEYKYLVGNRKGRKNIDISCLCLFDIKMYTLCAYIKLKINGIDKIEYVCHANA